MQKVTLGTATLYQGDCMDLMATLEDNAFDLAIVDPPYGIGDWTTGQSVNFVNGRKIVTKNGKFRDIKWNDAIPDNKYFEEVFRVSKNQIIWGANYYNLLELS